MTEPMRAVEIACALGISTDTFYRNRRRYELEDAMPAPLTSTGHPKWDRSTMLAWLRRNSHLTPRPPANDETPLAPASDEDFRRRFARAYGR